MTEAMRVKRSVVTANAESTRSGFLFTLDFIQFEFFNLCCSSEFTAQSIALHRQIWWLIYVLRSAHKLRWNWTHLQWWRKQRCLGQSGSAVRAWKPLSQNTVVWHRLRNWLRQKNNKRSINSLNPDADATRHSWPEMKKHLIKFTNNKLNMGRHSGVVVSSDAWE